MNSTTSTRTVAAPRRLASHVEAPPAALLEARDLTKSYQKGSVEIPVLRGVHLDVHHGEHLAVVGQSGSGKSTLLHLLATLDAPDEGSILFQGERIDGLTGRRRDAIRNGSIAVVFQFYHLLPELTTLENVMVPLMIEKPLWSYLSTRREAAQRACALLARMGLSHRLNHRPRELSGGEMQRAAIARALVTQPQVLLADEPTGNLDPETGREIVDILRSLNEDEGLTIVMVTHDDTLAAKADRIVRLADGLVQSQPVASEC